MEIEVGGWETNGAGWRKLLQSNQYENCNDRIRTSSSTAGGCFCHFPAFGHLRVDGVFADGII